jgi:mRNA interferase MazF
MEKIGMRDFPKRGEIYWANLDPTVGTEINKKRPCLIISSDEGNEVCSRVTVAAITSTVNTIHPFQVKIFTNKKEGKVLLNQIRTIDKQRLEGKITSLDKATMLQVDKAIKISLSLA